MWPHRELHYERENHVSSAGLRVSARARDRYRRYETRERHAVQLCDSERIEEEQPPGASLEPSESTLTHTERGRSGGLAHLRGATRLR
jgi:hypothetical protein